jgi:hypothetical protein
VGIVDAPLVDSWADTVYAYVGDDGNTLSGSNCDNTTGCEGVFRFSIKTGATGTAQGFSTSPNANVCTPANGTSWATGGTNGNACGAESVFGVGTATTALYDGSFDNTYYGSDTTQGGTPAGDLWSCVQIGATGAKLAKTAISSSTYGFSGNALSLSTNVINPLTNAAASCSPLTEFYNTVTNIDWIYFSLTASGSQAACTGACLYNVNVTSEPGTATATAGIATTGGSSGIVIDNAANTTTYLGASQIYYSPLGSQTCGTGGAGGCAVQAAQSAP